jgi:hypothetical protein
MTNDRRRFRRYMVPKVEKVRLGNRMKVKDVSIRGMGFETLDCLEVGQRYCIRVSREDIVFEFIGRIRWAQCIVHLAGSTNRVPGIYRAGIEFDTLLSHQLDGLLSLLKGGTHEVWGVPYREEIDTGSFFFPAAVCQ